METSFTKVIPNKNDCAQYMGTVTVSAYLGDRLIKQETHHNGNTDYDVRIEKRNVVKPHNK